MVAASLSGQMVGCLPDSSHIELDLVKGCRQRKQDLAVRGTIDPGACSELYLHGEVTVEICGVYLVEES